MNRSFRDSTARQRQTLTSRLLGTMSQLTVVREIRSVVVATECPNIGQHYSSKSRPPNRRIQTFIWNIPFPSTNISKSFIWNWGSFPFESNQMHGQTTSKATPLNQSVNLVWKQRGPRSEFGNFWIVFFSNLQKILLLRKKTSNDFLVIYTKNRTDQWLKYGETHQYAVLGPEKIEL